MSQLLTAARMGAIERAAMDAGAVTGLELMERAGRGAVQAMLAWRPGLATTAHRAVVLCGPGNNGGDGFVVARLLRQRGWEVTLHLFGDEAKLPPDAARNCRAWRALETVHPLAGFAAPPAGTLVVDALFGTGLGRPLGAEIRTPLAPLLADAAHAADTVALDMPSGLCGDSGRRLGGHAIPAALTVSFHRAKTGHHLAEGPATCGRLAVVDIGLGDPPVAGDPPPARLAAPDRAALTKAPGAHKYGHGHALILSGGVGRGGAARLAARGALRIGAGLVTVGCPPAALIENAARLDAIMLRPVADADALTAALADARLNALCLGPGLGAGARTRSLVLAALDAAAAGRHTATALTLDADALTSFAGDPTALFAALHRRCVLTPHMGEFARLFPDLAERLAAPAESGPAWSRLDAARAAAARAGCTVLLKGPDTVIAAPSGQAVISAAHYDRAAPWLATAGAGDVLAGFVTGLLARGLAPVAAAGTAAWLHVECARRVGPGLIAEDLPEALPAVLRDTAR